MSWGDVETTLDDLMRASQRFDCGEIIRLLKEAPTGYAPNYDTSDLVWCQNEAERAEPVVEYGGDTKIRKLPL